MLPLLLLMAGTFCQPSTARELIIGVSENDYTPFYFEEDGHFKGAAADIAAVIARRLGHSLIYRRFPWKRVQHSLATGKIDMVILYFKTPDRAEHVYYTRLPHIYESSSLVVSTDSPIAFEGNLDNMASYLFGNVTGYWHGADYSENKTLKRLQLDSTRTLLATLVRGKLDIAVGNKPVMLALAWKMKIADKIRFLEPKIDYAPDYMAFSKARPQAEMLAAQFSDELETFLKSEDYQAILQRYGFERPPSS